MVNDGHATGSRMVVVALALAMLALFVVNIFVGSTHVPPSQVLEVLGACLGCPAGECQRDNIVHHSAQPLAAGRSSCVLWCLVVGSGTDAADCIP